GVIGQSVNGKALSYKCKFDRTVRDSVVKGTVSTRAQTIHPNSSYKLRSDNFGDNRPSFSDN
ncbi:MAG: hypothetical protein ABI857_11450, partial [Acidobacteriota bacterium]